MLNVDCIEEMEISLGTKTLANRVNEIIWMALYEELVGITSWRFLERHWIWETKSRILLEVGRRTSMASKVAC